MVGKLLHDHDDGAFIGVGLGSCVNELEGCELVVVDSTYVHTWSIMLEHDACIRSNNTAVCSPINESASS